MTRRSIGLGWVVSGCIVSTGLAGGEICSTDADCNDNNVCTQDDCEIVFPGVGFCVHSPLSGNACPDDNNICTRDLCSNGICTHPATVGNACTDDGNICTTDRCANGVCTHPPSSGNTCMDDGNDCTADVCGGGQCTHPNRAAGTACDDGRQCTENDVCDGAGSCEGTPIPDCGPSCPFGVALDAATNGEEALNVFRNYRDTILAGSLEGRGYTALYYRHAPEVSAIIETSPTVRRQLVATLFEFRPAVQGVLAGDDVVIDRTQVARMDDLIRAVQRQAGEELSADLETLRSTLQKGGTWTTLGIQVEPPRPGRR